jgi:hypothetical protein
VDLDGALELGQVLASAAPIPGLLLVLLAFQQIHALARDLQACDEEGARLMVFCAAMTRALAPVAERLRPTPPLTDALDRAARALGALRELLETNSRRGLIERLLNGDEFRDAAAAARREVERAVRGAMDAAQLQGVEDAAETRRMVELLLRRRWRAARGARMNA